jgi:hypothetical protein
MKQATREFTEWLGHHANNMNNDLNGSAAAMPEIRQKVACLYCGTGIRNL